MSYQAIVIPVMIASPGDVSDERDIIRETLLRWNDINTAAQRVVLLPVGWETQAAPDLSGRPQELINVRLLDHCDLLVGVFWTRLGTPTGEHESGTVEEVRRHITSGKPAMIYFSSRPVAPGSYDNSQFEGVQKFKQWCQPKGIFKSFDNVVDFERKFQNDLAIILRDNPHLRELTHARQPINSLAPPEPQKAEEILSPEAIDMLLKAARSIRGNILMLPVIGGTVFQVGMEVIEHDGSAREIARLERSIDELEELGLIKARGHQREVFGVTDEGFATADRLTKAVRG